jgi:mycothiol synthase
LSEEKKPRQLQMLWPSSWAGTPPFVSVADGYNLRTFRPGEMEAYLELAHKARFDHFTAESVAEYMTRVIPGGFFVVEHDETGDLVASAMAQHVPDEMHPEGGVLGWVMGMPGHSGRGLGATVCAAATARLLRAGYERIYLKTDDWRLPALKTYFKLGWVPLLFEPDMEERWREVCAKLDWEFAPENWRELTGFSLARARADEYSLANHPPRYKWLPHREHRAYLQSAGDVDAYADEWLYKPSQLGSARAGPGAVGAGEESGLELTYLVGETALPAGSRVRFAIRGQNPLGRKRAAAEVRGPEGCELGAGADGFTVKNGALNKGDEVTLAWSPFAWTPLAGRREFKVIVATPGVPERYLPEPVVVEIRPRELARVEATLPCTHRGDEHLPVRITARDEFDNCVPLDGSVSVGGPEGETSAIMAGGLADARVAAGGGPLTRVEARAGEAAAASNPSVRTDGLQLFVGDLHCHDHLSAAEGYPDEVYRWAREDRALDFVSVVPQVHGYLDNEKWAVVRATTERFLEEGRFVTLLGFEWQHSGYGDKVAHFLGGTQPFLPVNDPRYAAPRGLYSALRKSDALIVSHHPGYALDTHVPGTDWEAMETDVDRLVEIWSMHGSSEGFDPDDRPLVGKRRVAGAMEALRKGLRFGLLAGSDTHSGRPGGSAKEPRPYWGGLAAVWARDLTRRAIFEALRARRTYALTRARIVLRVTVNGEPMGSELPAAERAEILVEAWAPGKIARVQVLKNAELLREFECSGDSARLELEDATGGTAFYHCRVTQEDGELAVCSPVWIG